VTTILIVDDDAALAYVTARSLQEEIPAVQVLTVGSCAEARLVADRIPPALVISVIELSDGNGLALVRELSQGFPKMAAIVTSALAPPDNVHRLPFTFLEKPYQTDTLLRLVAQALSLSDEELSRGTPDQRPSGGQSSSSYDRHDIRNRLAALLAGLRAFGADLLTEANNPAAVRRLVDEYVDRLCGIASEVAQKLPEWPKETRGNDD